MNVIVSNNRRNELNTLSIDVIKSVEGEYTVEELIGMFTNFFFNKMVIDITAIKDNTDYSNLKKLFQSIDGNKVIILLDELSNTKEFISDLITLGVYNFSNNFEDIINLFNNPKNYNDVANLQIAKSTYDVNKEIDEELGINQNKEFTFEDFTLPGEYDGNKKIIGVVNLTSHAGATTLVVQMVKQLNINYKAIGIEMDKQVIVDLNSKDYKEFCTDVIYLIEPGTIKLTKLIKRNGKIFEELSGEKIVLNRTNLDEKGKSEFEVESNIKVFSVVSNFRDNLDRVISVDRLLSNLGYTKCLKEEKNKEKPEVSVKKKFSFFGKKN